MLVIYKELRSLLLRIIDHRSFHLHHQPSFKTISINYHNYQIKPGIKIPRKSLITPVGPINNSNHRVFRVINLNYDSAV